jgi:hypothetical protein
LGITDDPKDPNPYKPREVQPLPNLRICPMFRKKNGP